MTTEVAVMNKQAVALAADSAGTVIYKKGEKIYFSKNKLFMLAWSKVVFLHLGQGSGGRPVRESRTPVNMGN